MMPNTSFTNLALVAAIAFGAPLLLGFAPKLRLPATVLEILAGIVLGVGWNRPAHMILATTFKEKYPCNRQWNSRSWCCAPMRR